MESPFLFALTIFVLPAVPESVRQWRHHLVSRWPPSSGRVRHGGRQAGLCHRRPQEQDPRCPGEATNLTLETFLFKLVNCNTSKSTIYISLLSITIYNLSVYLLSSVKWSNLLVNLIWLHHCTMGSRALYQQKSPIFIINILYVLFLHLWEAYGL